MSSALLGERLNSPPLVFKGYTDRELVTAIGLSAAVSLPVCGLVGLLLGKIQMGLAGGMLVMLGLVAGGSGLFQRWKRGRPLFFLEQAVQGRLAARGWVRSSVCRHRGVMGVSRSSGGVR